MSANDLSKRIEAVKTAQVAGGTAAASPIEPAALPPLLIDLIAEQRQVIKALQQAVADQATVAARANRDLPEAFRAVARSMLAQTQAQLQEQGAQFKQLGDYVKLSGEKSTEATDTLRALIMMILVAAGLVAGAIILDHYL